MLTIKELQRNRRYVFGILALLLIALIVAKAPSTGSLSTASLPSSKTGPQIAMPGGTGGAAADVSQATDPAATGAPGTVVIGHSIKNDVSPPLRSIPIILPTKGQQEGPENPLPITYPKEHINDPVVQNWFGSLTIPTPIVSFDGVNNINGVLPPDTQGDVGPNHYVQWVNLSFQIWNKTGTSLFGPANGNTLWAGFGGPCQTSNSGDPITLYDPIADRWMMTQFTTSAPYYQCIAVSTSPDPLGTWNRYGFIVSTNLLNDYPHFGVWPDAYYMTANRFLGGATYDSPVAIAFDRVRMIAGQPATFQLFNPGNYFYSILPADLDGSTPPPAGAPNYFATSAGTSNSVRLWRFHVDWVTPANSTFTGPINLTMAPFDPNMCDNARSCIRQPGTTVGVDSIGGRSMYRLAYRNFGTHESLVTNQTVDVDGADHAGIRWYEIRSPGSGPFIYQAGTYAPDAASRWMGSIAMDRDGNIGLGYSASSSTIYPSVRYTGRLATDPLGTLPQGEGEIMAGTGSQTHSASRWGDYSMMAVDPVDDCTFWFTSEYLATTGAAPWRTRIGSFKFPSCGQPPPPTATGTPPTATRTPTPLPPTPTACGNYTYATATATIEAGTVDIGNHCDDCTTYITMPFPIRLYGRSFTNAYVSSNGNIQFDSSDNAFGNACLSVPIFEYAISLFWDDLYTGDTVGGQGVFSSVSGSAPNRIFNLEWRTTLCCTPGAPTNIFEVRLREGGGPFEIIYGALSQAGTGQTVGVQRDIGGYTQFSCNTASLSNGLKITFSPPACYNVTPTPTATPCIMPFTDVLPTDYFYEGVHYLYCHGAISGYGTVFLPYNLTTRGQLTKIVTLAEGWTFYTPPVPTFRDVPTTHTFYQYIETAYHQGIISGYGCGTGCLEFRPEANVTRAQLCKIIVNAEAWAPYTPPAPTFRDVPDTDPFYSFIETAYFHSIISGYSCGTGCLEFRPGANATRGQICKIVHLAVTAP